MVFIVLWNFAFYMSAKVGKIREVAIRSCFEFLQESCPSPSKSCRVSAFVCSLSGVKGIRPRYRLGPGTERRPPDHRVYTQVGRPLCPDGPSENESFVLQGEKTRIGRKQNRFLPIHYMPITLISKETSLPCHFKGFLFFTYSRGESSPRISQSRLLFHVSLNDGNNTQNCEYCYDS